jgi:hypothetical protein
MTSVPLATHPYFKLDYFEHEWGGADEQEEEIRNGNPNAKNWQEEARKVLVKAVRSAYLDFPHVI